METKILSLNCQGLGSNEKRLDMFTYLKSKHCHIYCLQETHFINDASKFIQAQWGSECLFSHGTSNSKGVAIMFAKDVELVVHDHIASPDGTFIIADLTIDSNRLTLINLYAPNKDSPDFFENIISQANIFKNDKLILCGDFNVIQDQTLDCYNYNNLNNKKAQKKIIEIKNDCRLFDPFRENYPTLKRYTWRRKNPLKQARLDYFLISETLLASTKACKIDTSYRSDHSPITLEIQFVEFKHGKGLWKFNNSLLKDIEYLDIINKKINEIKQQYALPIYNFDNLDLIPNSDIQFTINDQLFLDTLLMEIRGKTISYASYKRKQNESEEIKLDIEIKTIEQNLTEENMEKLETLKQTLTNLRNIKMHGYLIRSRANIIENDEKPSRYFCNLESQNFTSKIIPKIIKPDGQVITKQQDILQETRNFYQSLYSDRDDSLFNVNLYEEFANININKLSNEESLAMDTEISYEEAKHALKNMKNNRSPGSDGYSADFFKVFWKDIGHFIVRSLNYGYANGELSMTQKEGIIICIPKENKPRTDLKNYRPISLLNCVYKIASTVIANRIKVTLPKLINYDQTGFIAGRYMGENTRQIYDIMQYAEENNIPGLLLLIDFEKAFDSLSWKFIFKVLEFFNFSKTIVSWIKVLYKNSQQCINIGGNLSQFFQIQRGCRQGDPISPYIFILCAEILAIKIRNNSNIKGIKIGDTHFKFSQYADDSSVILDGSHTSLNETLNELYQYGKYSGLNINFSKTCVVWIGAKKYSGETINTRWKLNWGLTQFKLLGIQFDVDLDKMIKINYSNKMEKLKNLIKRWKRRYLTPLGKITVIKSVLVSMFNHLFISLPNPDTDTMNEMNKLLYDFLWEGPAKIKTNIIVKEYFEGGLKMLNLNAFINSLKLTWIRRLIITPGKWSKVINHIITLKSITQYASIFGNKLAIKTKNKFWRDVLEAYVTFIDKQVPDQAQELLAVPIFYNKLFMINDSHVHIKNWYGKGIIWVADLINENGRFYTENELKDIYGLKTNFIEYQTITKPIKQYMKAKQINLFDTTEYPLFPYYITLLMSSKKGTKDVYPIFNNNSDVPTAKYKWQNMYDMDEATWIQIFLSPFNSTKSTRLQWLQIRINNNILPTKRYLFKIKANDTPNCYTCQENETISHMLWHCPETKTFLRNIQEYLLERNITTKFYEQSFIFNIGNSSHSDLTFYLKLKEYIFTSKFHNKPLHVSVAIHRFKQHYQILKCIETNINNKKDDFNKEWTKYDNILLPID